MSEIILDMGSGNSCHNSIDYACKMIDAVVAIDSHKHEVIFKWQLFSNEPPNLPLDHLVFSRAYTYAKAAGYKTTSSVFDVRSLDFLLNFDIPFVKIACRPRLYWLIGEVPRKIPVYVSCLPYEFEGGDSEENNPKNIFDVDDQDGGKDVILDCVPKYPAMLKDYEDGEGGYPSRISDHVIGLELWNASCEYEKWVTSQPAWIFEKIDAPEVWEKHFILENDPKNPDAAGHAIKPDLLKEVIG